LFPNPLLAEGALDRLLGRAHHLVLQGRYHRQYQRPDRTPTATRREHGSYGMTCHALTEHSKRDGLRDGSVPVPGPNRCPICEGPLPSPRAQYCKDACKQRAFRLRHQPVASIDVGKLRQDFQHRRTLVARTLYECASCGERRLGESRCADRGLLSHALGLAGSCPGCDEPILLAGLLGLE